MANFFDKVENFLFDFLGLVLPGFILMSIIVAPLFLFDFSKIPEACLGSSSMLSSFAIISKYLAKAFESKSEYVIPALLLLAYILGHVVKVFSIIFYELAAVVFDKGIIAFIAVILKKGSESTYKIFRPLGGIYRLKMDKSPQNLLSKIFIFKSSDYFLDNENLKDKCVDTVNKKLNTEFPKVWYSLYKFSSVLSHQENYRSLSPFFLAKYNLYRSLSFIFLFSLIYFTIFYSVTHSFLSQNVINLKGSILILMTLLWFTFHVKYKRYWTLCGNEALVSLFYYLHKDDLKK